MKSFNLKNILFVQLLLFTAACSGPTPNTDTASETTAAVELIQVSQQQFDADNMKIGEISMQNFEDVVTCNAYLSAPAEAIARISTPISGIVQTISCNMGDYVHQGNVLLTISSNELLTLQQNFVETSSKMKKVKADYDRNKALFDENIGSQKDFLNSENEYTTTLATYESLKLRLKLLNLNTSKIEAGEFVSSFPVIAPISGYITSMKAVLGEFSMQQDKIIEIVDVKKLVLKLSVFEKDVSRMKIGQSVLFNSLNDKKSIHQATIYAIGKTIDEESKTISCLAKIDDEEGVNWINNTYVEARIVVDKIVAKALPTGAIVKSGNEYYVFILEKKEGENYFLKKEKVEVGMISNGFSEILVGAENKKIITAGVYNLRIE